MSKISNDKHGLVKSPLCRHCEERSDAAISIFQAVMNCEIAEFIPSVKTRLLRFARKDGLRR
jgi:hypothetical protein